jgi:hypothetical protein
MGSIAVIVARRLAWHNGTGKRASRQRLQGSETPSVFKQEEIYETQW